MTICLTMIVKNEAAVIERCLAAVRDHIDYWVIVDTGSTDDTKALVLDALFGVPGELHSHAWRGFGEARTRAFELAKGKADYALVIDADETVTFAGPRPDLTDDAYAVWAIPNDNAKCATHRIFRLDMNWRYEGVIHEYPVSDAGLPRPDVELIDWLTIDGRHTDGARSTNPQKYRDDALTIGAALVNDPGNARLVFYLAQSWRDAGDDERAARHYLQRAEMGIGTNPEEIYISLLEAGRALARSQRLFEAEAVLFRARLQSPTRPEAAACLGQLSGFLGRNLPPTGTVAVETCHYRPDEAAA